jgi:hypothetical protein
MAAGERAQEGGMTPIALTDEQMRCIMQALS